MTSDYRRATYVLAVAALVAAATGAAIAAGGPGAAGADDETASLDETNLSVVDRDDALRDGDASALPELLWSEPGVRDRFDQPDALTFEATQRREYDADAGRFVDVDRVVDVHVSPPNDRLPYVRATVDLDDRTVDVRDGHGDPDIRVEVADGDGTLTDAERGRLADLLASADAVRWHAATTFDGARTLTVDTVDADPEDTDAADDVDGDAVRVELTASDVADARLRAVVDLNDGTVVERTVTERLDASNVTVVDAEPAGSNETVAVSVVGAENGSAESGSVGNESVESGSVGNESVESGADGETYDLVVRERGGATGGEIRFDGDESPDRSATNVSVDGTDVSMTADRSVFRLTDREALAEAVATTDAVEDAFGDAVALDVRRRQTYDGDAGTFRELDGAHVEATPVDGSVPEVTLTVDLDDGAIGDGDVAVESVVPELDADAIAVVDEADALTAPDESAVAAAVAADDDASESVQRALDEPERVTATAVERDGDVVRLELTAPDRPDTTVVVSVDLDDRSVANAFTVLDAGALETESVNVDPANGTEDVTIDAGNATVGTDTGNATVGTDTGNATADTEDGNATADTEDGNATADTEDG